MFSLELVFRLPVRPSCRRDALVPCRSVDQPARAEGIRQTEELDLLACNGNGQTPAASARSAPICLIYGVTVDTNTSVRLFTSLFVLTKKALKFVPSFASPW